MTLRALQRDVNCNRIKSDNTLLSATTAWHYGDSCVQIVSAHNAIRVVERMAEGERELDCAGWMRNGGIVLADGPPAWHYQMTAHAIAPMRPESAALWPVSMCTRWNERTVKIAHESLNPR